MLNFKNKILFSISIIITSTSIYCQQLPEVEELFLTIDKKDISKLERSLNTMNEAEQILGEARDIYSDNDESTNNAAIKRLHIASSKQKNAVFFMYDVYHNYIKAITDGMKAQYREEMHRGKYYQDRTSDYFKKANANRKALENINNFKDYYFKLLQTFEYERMGIINIARALRIYQDWPVEYDYNWDSFEREINPLLAEDRRRDSIADIQQIKTGSKDSSIVFKVQIAAHTIEMPEEYLHAVIYFGKRKIYMSHNDGWYKYDIGTFYTYAEAKKILIVSKVEKAFVASYKNDKRINITEALVLLKGK